MLTHLLLVICGSKLLHTLEIYHLQTVRSSCQKHFLLSEETRTRTKILKGKKSSHPCWFLKSFRADPTWSLVSSKIIWSTDLKCKIELQERITSKLMKICNKSTIWEMRSKIWRHKQKTSTQKTVIAAVNHWVYPPFILCVAIHFTTNALNLNKTTKESVLYALTNSVISSVKSSNMMSKQKTHSNSSEIWMEVPRNSM